MDRYAIWKMQEDVRALLDSKKLVTDYRNQDMMTNAECYALNARNAIVGRLRCHDLTGVQILLGKEVFLAFLIILDPFLPGHTQDIKVILDVYHEANRMITDQDCPIITE